MSASAPTREALQRARVEEAAAPALLYEDDETNLRAALAARRLNPGLRLVIRMYNRKLGHHLEELLDQAAIVAGSSADRAALDASTTVLSDADTAAPALVATAVADTNKVVQAYGQIAVSVSSVNGTSGRPDTGREDGSAPLSPTVGTAMPAASVITDRVTTLVVSALMPISTAGAMSGVGTMSAGPAGLRWL